MYGVFTQDGLDQVCSGKVDAAREAKDLRAMGCETCIIYADSELHFDAADDVLRDGGTFAAARRAVAKAMKGE